MPGTALPNNWFDHWPHSPFWAGFIRSQSGTKSRSASFQLRFVVVTRSAIGLLAMKMPPICSASRYWPALTRSDVLPSPKMSYAIPPRSERSL
ncbi:hypothetical protein D3C83_15710 [compost metagenome]